MIQWKDETSYDAREPVQPRTAIVHDMRVTVHRLTGYAGWFGTCHEMRADRVELQSATVEGACVEFLAYLRRLAHQRYYALMEAT